jgi:hypothetical protein
MFQVSCVEMKRYSIKHYYVIADVDIAKRIFFWYSIFCYYILQNVIFRAGQKTKRICHTAATLNKGEISPWRVDNWENDTLTIPADTPPSTDKHFSTIQIKYTFTVRTK